jgi:hypothetical protein
MRKIVYLGLLATAVLMVGTGDQVQNKAQAWEGPPLPCHPQFIICTDDPCSGMFGYGAIFYCHTVGG